MLVVALTGGIGAGKSTALAILEDLGAHAFRLDDIAHEVLAPGSPAVDEIASRWPSVVHGGEVDRAALSHIVFDDSAALADLEAIVHPATWLEVDARIGELALRKPDAIAVFELALLVGSPRQDWAHFNLGIEAAQDARIARLEGERGMDADDARARMARQASPAAFEQVCDAVIHNDGSVESLASQIRALWAGRLVPYATNLAQGRKDIEACEGMGELVPSGAAESVATATRRAQARLSAHGVSAVQAGLALLELESPASAEQLRSAGFVPRAEGFVSADPFSPVLCRQAC